MLIKPVFFGLDSKKCVFARLLVHSIILHKSSTGTISNVYLHKRRRQIARISKCNLSTACGITPRRASLWITIQIIMLYWSLCGSFIYTVLLESWGLYQMERLKKTERLAPPFPFTVINK